MTNAAATGPDQAPEWSPRVNPWLITAAVMLPTFMEVLDTTIASVALALIALGCIVLVLLLQRVAGRGPLGGH